MSAVIGWAILVVVLSAISWGPPLFDMRGGYWRAFGSWNMVIIPILVSAGLMTALLMYALHLIGVYS